MDEIVAAIQEDHTKTPDDTVIAQLRRVLNDESQLAGDSAKIQKFLSQSDENGLTLLEHALRSNRKKLFKFLLDRDAKLSAKTPQPPAPDPAAPPAAQANRNVPREFLSKRGWPYTTAQEGVIAFLTMSLIFAIAGALRMTHKAWPTIFSIMVWIGMTTMSRKNRLFMKRIFTDFLGSAKNQKTGSSSTAAPESTAHGYPGRLIVFEGPDGTAIRTIMEQTASHFEDQLHMRVTRAVWSKDKLAKFVEKRPGARQPKGYTDKYTRKGEYEKGDIFVIQPDLNPQEIAERDCFAFALQVATEIRPALERGALIFVDRYWYYSIVRFIARGGKNSEELEKRFAFAPKPDAVFFVQETAEKIIAALKNDKPQMEYLENAWKFTTEQKPGSEFDDDFPDLEPQLQVTSSDVGMDLYTKPDSGVKNLGDALERYFSKQVSQYAAVGPKLWSAVPCIVPLPNKIDSAVSICVDSIVNDVIGAENLTRFHQAIPRQYQLWSFVLIIASAVATTVAVLLEIANFSPRRLF